MDEKDKRIESLEIQLKAQKQLNNGMKTEMLLIQKDAVELLDKTYQLIKKVKGKSLEFEKQAIQEDGDFGLTS